MQRDNSPRVNAPQVLQARRAFAKAHTLNVPLPRIEALLPVLQAAFGDSKGTAGISSSSASSAEGGGGSGNEAADMVASPDAQPAPPVAPAGSAHHTSAAPSSFTTPSLLNCPTQEGRGGQVSAEAMEAAAAILASAPGLTHIAATQQDGGGDFAVRLLAPAAAAGKEVTLSFLADDHAVVDDEDALGFLEQACWTPTALEHVVELEVALDVSVDVGILN